MFRPPADMGASDNRRGIGQQTTRGYLLCVNNLAGLTMNFSQRKVWQPKARGRQGCILCSPPDSLQPAEASWQVLPRSSHHSLFLHPLTWLLADSAYSFLLECNLWSLVRLSSHERDRPECLRMNTPTSPLTVFPAATSEHLFSSVPWDPHRTPCAPPSGDPSDSI